ncbi:OmpA family protein [Pontibaca salina]|uniref:OmpA family protein n=1 Tax=Pontibaca salina TaxID=2795731 RepID=A0A934HQF0_9RHOB|nr:OmpA family protein [Pontibaca salina]MBI6629587.1 OmpA family protein [Pontibaca salina]
MRAAIALFFALTLAAGPVRAGDLALPADAQRVTQEVSARDSYAMPIGPHISTGVATRSYEGRVDRQAWRVEKSDLTTLQLLDPLRAQLQEDGYEILFQCKDIACGGFDFRFAIDVIPAPEMYVDVRNYRFLAAARGEGEAISLLVSRSRASGFVQIIRVAPSDEDTSASVAGPISGPATTDDFATQLTSTGYVVLHDLDFQTGADTLGPGPHATLGALASFLQDNAEYRISLVGHTDTVGGLESNIELSRRRAGAVRVRLIEGYGIAAKRIDTEGVGYLAPVASNLTAQGREANRRVEAVLLSGQ